MASNLENIVADNSNRDAAQTDLWLANESLPDSSNSHKFICQYRPGASVIRRVWAGEFTRQGVERHRCDGSYNDFDESPTHSQRNGTTPVNPERAKVININEYRGKMHCRGLFHRPIAA
jgi:hypothetical protein